MFNRTRYEVRSRKTPLLWSILDFSHDTLDMSIYSYELRTCITIEEAMKREEIEDCAEFLTYYANNEYEDVHDLWLHFLYKKLYT